MFYTVWMNSVALEGFPAGASQLDSSLDFDCTTRKPFFTYISTCLYVLEPFRCGLDVCQIIVILQKRCPELMGGILSMFLAENRICDSIDKQVLLVLKEQRSCMVLLLQKSGKQFILDLCKPTKKLNFCFISLQNIF